MENIEDLGHQKLIADIELLIELIETLQSEAGSKEFHDFFNQNYAMPKIALMAQLIEIKNVISMIMENVREGKYDNR